MSHSYAILREADCQIEPAQVASILAPLLGMAQVEVRQALHDRPGMLAWDLPLEVAREGAQGLILAGMPCRAVRDDHLIAVPEVPRNTIRSAVFEGEHFVFRSAEWEGHVPWENIRLLDIVQEVKAATELIGDVPSHLGSDPRSNQRHVRRTKIDVSVFLEIICTDPVLRMRIDRSLFNYKSTGLTMHTNREKNFRALCIALNLRCPAALMGPGFHWIANGNNSHHASGNTRKKFENFATWLLTVEA
ncbi:hypothetical protein DTL42_07560 [Bremerella cremea]|uniref:Uncharacterized protein n=1 Tax=Bremerella cremea TaxID=1031537 RepID=A0A368KSP4_9BACT|nr:hypothetical protein [Bremerella cremea]RCS52687.1 hypothetical protein DTL42_07560 [Bremerella cremea]